MAAPTRDEMIGMLENVVEAMRDVVSRDFGKPPFVIAFHQAQRALEALKADTTPQRRSGDHGWWRDQALANGEHTPFELKRVDL